MDREQPSWYTDEDMSTWDRIKNAFKNDWEQTRHDFGSDTARDLDQDVDDTVKQAAGTDDAFENREQAFRFGHAARRQYGADHDEWDDSLERKLSADYSGHFARDREDIRYGYDYRASRPGAGEL